MTRFDLLSPPSGSSMMKPLLAQTDGMIDPDAGILESLIAAFRNLGQQIVDFTPKLVVGIALLLVGFVAARIIRSIITGVTGKLGLDAIANRVGMSQLFGRFGIKSPVSVVLGQIVFAFLVLFLLKLSSDVLGITDISQGINAIIAFLPRLVVAILILLAGMLAGELIRNILQTRMDDKGIDYSETIAGLAYGLFMVMIVTVVFSQLGIDTMLLNWTVLIVVASTGLALALCLGPSLRPIAKNVVSGVYARDLFSPGSIIDVDGKSAKVLVVGAVATRLESEDGSFLVIPNQKLITESTEGRTAFSEKIEKS